MKKEETTATHTPEVGKDGYELWLDYRPIQSAERLAAYRQRLQAVALPGDGPTLVAARRELERALTGLLDRPAAIGTSRLAGPGLLAGTPQSARQIAALGWDEEIQALGPEGYLIRTTTVDQAPAVVIAAATEIGVLYGTFHLLRLLQTRRSLTGLDIAERPAIERRLLDHWDNLDRSVERGYAGPSIWKWDELPETLDPRYRDYARACASLGINGVALNNVNADPKMVRSDYVAKAAALADALRPYGVRVYLSINFSSPLGPGKGNLPNQIIQRGGIGDLETADPLDPDVRAWWQAKANEIYRHIPDCGGFLVKANSEGMPGPSDYGRSHAEGANMLAQAVAPHGGIVMWRAFVYDPDVDPDRTKRAYIEFKPLDGAFDENVFVQVKNGPLDFQPREPFHPLYGAMDQTPLMMELQITQEYLGQSKHLVYLAPMWKEVLESETFAQGPGSTVAQVVDGSLHDYAMTGIAGVANVGSERNWCGHHFAQANWYAFGRLAWDPSLSAEGIAEAWVRATFTNDDSVVATIREMMMGSWEACVNYMLPLGLHHLHREGHHYGPDLYYETGRADWDPQTYHRADAEGLGYDRSSSGSNAVSQYFPPLCDVFDDRETCPEKFLLWFHHVPWGHQMRSGRTLWEELARHYHRGVAYVRHMAETWASLKDQIDPRRHEEVQEKLATQEEDALEWPRESLAYFQQLSQRPIPEPMRDDIISEVEAS